MPWVAPGPSTPATTPPGKCPRCAEELEAVKLKGVSVRSCKRCQGTLLTQPQLAPLLGEMSAELLRTFNPDAQLEAVPDKGGGLRCPRCAKVLTTDDYCSAHIVYFDRCEPCGLLWLDADELGTMTLMWARMEARHLVNHFESGLRAGGGGMGVVGRLLVARAVGTVLFELLG
jgi:Zn-finger nucleic acid-binding protein